MTTTTDIADAGVRAQLDRLLAIREQLRAERQGAVSPAVDRSLEMADYYLFLALTYFGYTERLFPEQD
jgi:hypothetical protein